MIEPPSRDELRAILDNMIKEFLSQIKDLETENGVLLQMLKDLVNKLDEIEESEDYKGIWSFLHAHNYSYNGPNYCNELKKAKEIILVTKG